MNIESFFKITYGLYIVSSVKGNKKNGFVSNTVFQVTAEPAQLAIACSKNNYTAQIIAESNVFAASVLSKDVKADIIGTFGYKSGRDVEKFENVQHLTGSTGVPILTEDCLSWFECEVVQTIDVGSHIIFIGKVIDNAVLEDVGEPLTYAYYREVRKGKAPKNAPTYVDPEKFKSAKEHSKNEIYVCNACGHEYNPEKGDPEHGIPPGTPFDQLPTDWVCPVCGAEKSEFSKK